MHTHTHTCIYRGTFLLQAATNGCALRCSKHTDDFCPCFDCCTITKLQQL